MSEKQKPDKYDSSPFERGYEQLCLKLVPVVPRSFSPNALTMTAFVGFLVAGLSFYLAGYSKWWFIPAILGLLTHLTLDNIDGAVARSRNQASPRGQFLDIITDCVGMAAVFLGIGYSSYADLKFVLLPLVVWYLHLILEYNWILLKNKWIFPYLSNFELHVTLSLLALISILWGVFHFDIAGFTIGMFDIICAASALFSLVEFLYYAVKLYKESDAVYEKDNTPSKS